MSVLCSYLSDLLCQLVCLPVCPPATLCSYVSLSQFAACQSWYWSLCLTVCWSVCLSYNLSVSYLFIYCLICLSGIQRCLEVRLPSFTVKCLADWKGHFSNGAVLPLIFCLSLGVRLIYHASSPADIQIHFDWRLDGMTPTTTNTASITAALTHLHKHTQSNVMLCILSQVCCGYEYACYTNTSHLNFDMKTLAYICSLINSRTRTQTKWITVVVTSVLSHMLVLD